MSKADMRKLHRLDFERVIAAHRERNWSEMHRILDEIEVRGGGNVNHLIAWRQSALIGEGRYEETLALLQTRGCECDCRTLTHAEIAELLHFFGRDKEALDELRRAPMDEEAERYPMLVVLAKYFFTYLLAANGLVIEKELLDAIPDGYQNKDIFGKEISKAALLDFITQQNSRQSATSCGCTTRGER